MFWSLPLADGDSPPVTLCEGHALEATNAAMGIVGEEEFPTMSAAALIMDSLLLINGKDTTGLTMSEEGVCEQCAWLVAREGA